MRKLGVQDTEITEDEVARIAFGRGYGRATDDEMSKAARIVELVQVRVLSANAEAPDAD